MTIVKAFLEGCKEKENGRREGEGERIKGGQTETHRYTREGFRWKGKELHKITWDGPKDEKITALLSFCTKF